MADEINPRTGKPYSKNPRAVNARRKRQLKVSEAANERQAELDLQQPENQPGTGNILTPEQIEINKKGLEEAKKKIREGGIVKIPEDGKNPLMIKQAGPDYAGEKAKVGTFDRDMEAYRKAQKKGNLTTKDRIRILGDNAKNYGRLAIRANPTATVLPIATGALSLMIKGLQGDILRGY
tara:strand:+ start:382 stop:918 length:537 start_codon:yes stop_codon:yes gene_type:complete